MYLLEVIAELNDGGLSKHAVRVHDKLAMLQRVEIAGDQKQIGAALYGQETATRDVDTMGTLEVLDRSTNSSLELDNRLAIISDLVVDDDIELHLARVHNALDRGKIHPQVVGVEDLELVDGLGDNSLVVMYVLKYNHNTHLEVLNVLRRHLGDF